MTNRQVAVSVLMPVHNGGAYLRSAVDSILGQQNVQFELIIIDDHSSDNALQALNRNDNVRFISSNRKGIVHALNTGIDAARHPFLARMDADDIAAPNRLETQLRLLLNNPEIDICGTKVRIFREQGSVAAGYRQYQYWINSLCEHQDIEREFFIESPIAHPSAMMKTQSMLKLGGYRDSPWPEDYDLWCRALLHGMKFAKPVNRNLLDWRDHEKRLSRTDRRYATQQFLRCKAHYMTAYLEKRGISHCVIWGAGPTGLKLHDYLEEEGLRVANFIDINPKMSDRLKRGKSVYIVNNDGKPSRDDGFWNQRDSASIIIVAVGARGARSDIRAFLKNKELLEGKDFLFAA